MSRHIINFVMCKTFYNAEVEELVCIKQIIASRKNGSFYPPDETSNFPTQEILPFLLEFVFCRYRTWICSVFVPAQIL